MDTGRTVLGPSLRRGLAPALGLLVLSPICAEYLIGYLEIMSRPLELLVGLLFLAPLYGTVAVMIREAVRRTGRGWPSILLLGAAFGLIQAGLIDQSLFNPAFIDDPFWDQERLPTLIPGLGISANHALTFIAGHAIWSFAAPIAVVESCVPRIADRPWLGKVGTSVMVALYALAVLVFFHEHTEHFMATPAQLGTTAALALVLIVAAFAIPRRRVRRPGRVPAAWRVGVLGTVLLTAYHLLPATWPGIALKAATLFLSGGLLVWWSARARWGRDHVLAVGGAALVANASLSFLVQPLGEVSYPAKYAANAALMLGVLALLAWARRRLLSAGHGASGEETREAAHRQEDENLPPRL
ncbi:hypothetical protein ABGB12_12110 [Actinocorallia sp. B10E7]|uniref:hypothetical protein n=1 Tax=Actinocorallia sp. B10E7 TaxID=3153558 RepID=UPI00325D0070